MALFALVDGGADAAAVGVGGISLLALLVETHSFQEIRIIRAYIFALAIHKMLPVHATPLSHALTLAQSPPAQATHAVIAASQAFQTIRVA